MDKADKQIKTYNPKEIEEKYYQIWEKRGYFEIEGNKNLQKENKNFCIMLPPPNVTGSLHIGHALNHTLIDIITRYKRMDGYKTLWQPGLDHAGIATQNIVEKQLLAQGVKKEEIGREAFIQKVWEWKEKSGGMILDQMRKLGVSPAMSRLRFTMDKGLQNAVKEAFVTLYEKGDIIRGEYLVHWCTHDGALSDIEVEYEENQGQLYYLKYFLENQKDFILVATTRPETYFGDTAVMVNPNDTRYSHLIGQQVTLPLINRKIPIIADSYVDMEFGTGAVKVTPAHDPNDYEVGKRHHLEQITIFNPKGILNKHAGEFEGLERLEAREKIIAKLQNSGFVEKIEPYTNQVGKCYRCGNIVEPYISKQWFLKKEAARGAIEKVDKNLLQFFPAQWKNNYNAWMRELRDWCISRQLWWGHQIPVFYCRDCTNEWASKGDSVCVCPKCGSENIYQDLDVLDTWFSSALWPFSTLGWGNEEWQIGQLWNKSDLEEFYPNTLLITGFDILFFWVARMLLMGDNLLNRLPFLQVYLHALVRDSKGEKMSKSKGNVIDPLSVITTHSADALRFTLAILCIQGRDIKLSSEQLDISKNFTNKLFNACNFLLLYEQNFPDLSTLTLKTPIGQYMGVCLSKAVVEVRESLDSYRFNDAASVLYRFLWGEFCDWGIELSKADKNSIIELGAIFKEALLLLHPFMPFISEYLWHRLSNSSLEESASIMIAPYPTFSYENTAITEIFAVILESIVAIRRLKATIDLANQKVECVLISFVNPIKKEFEELFLQLTAKLAKVDKVNIITQKPKNCIADVAQLVSVYLPLDNIDLAPITLRLSKQKEKIEKELHKLNGMLNNEKFVANAPKEVLQSNQNAQKELTDRLEKVCLELEALQALKE